MQSFLLPSLSSRLPRPNAVRRLVGSTQAFVSMSSHRSALVSRGGSVGAVAILTKHFKKARNLSKRFGSLPPGSYSVKRLRGDVANSADVSPGLYSWHRWRGQPSCPRRFSRLVWIVRCPGRRGARCRSLKPSLRGGEEDVQDHLPSHILKVSHSFKYVRGELWGLAFMVTAIPKQVSWTDGGASRHVLQLCLRIILREAETKVSTWLTTAHKPLEDLSLQIHSSLNEDSEFERKLTVALEFSFYYYLVADRWGFSPQRCSPDQRTCLKRSPSHLQTSLWPRSTRTLEPILRLFFCWEVWIKHSEHRCLFLFS